MAQLTVLIYDYVDEMLERRGPHRERHLAHVARWSADGRLALAGALGDPPSGALFAFEVEDAAEVEEFATADPYGEAGLVTARRIEPWNLVANRPLTNPPD